MKRRSTAGFVGVVLLASLAPVVLGAPVAVAPPADARGGTETVGPSVPARAHAPLALRADTLVLVVSEEGNRARYRVREQLARLDFPNDAVGETTGVRGSIVVTGDGTVVREGSRFLIDLAALESASDRRDNYLRRNTLATAEHPDAIFLPHAVRGLPDPVPATGRAEIVVEGELTIRDATRPVEWEAEVEFREGALVGRARTSFTFGDFDLDIPSVGSVLSIRDDIRLEYDFRLVPSG